jgi:ATP-binding cassette, subfamily B, bacterial MsbA
MSPIRECIQTIRAIFALLHHTRIPLRFSGISIALLVLAGLCTLVEMRFMMAFLTGLIVGDAGHIPLFGTYFDSLNSETLLGLSIGGFFLFALIARLFSYGSQLSVGKLQRHMTYILRQSLFVQYLSMRKSYFDQRSFADLQGSLLNKIDQIKNAFGAIHRLIGQSIILVVCSAFLWALSPQMSIIVIGAYGIGALWSVTTLYCTTQYGREEQKKLANTHKKIFNVLQNLTIIQAYNKEKEESEYFAAISKEQIDISNSMMQKMQVQKEFQHFFSLGVLLLVTALSLSLFKDTPLTHNTAGLLTFLIVIRMMAPHVEGITQHIHTILHASSSIETLTKLLIHEAKKEKHLVPQGKNVFKGISKNISFCGVVFSYPNTNNILRTVSFTVPAQKTTAIVGKTGCGKTTIAHLLMRFYDHKTGEILLDGQDIRSYTHTSLREHMTLMSQDIFLFNENLRKNISYGSQNSTSEAITRIVNQLALTEILQSNTDGLETIIGDKGCTLSGGEKQRIALARSLLRNTGIFIFDEPTSALDPYIEQRVCNAILEHTANKTLIVIAHTPRLIQHADHIIMLDKGKVVDEGDRENLLRVQGPFSQYWESMKENLVEKTASRIACVLLGHASFLLNINNFIPLWHKYF